jgi:solute carrier family 12 (potassium/chloride transporter), member 4/6
MVVLEVAFPHKILMAIALIMSSTGAAIECLAGAPRILYAMVQDGNLKFLNYFKGKFTLLMICNSFIALATTMIADINFINPINTVFFLIPYGMLNFVTLFADTLHFPNWRPTYNYFNKPLCFLGFSLSIIMMILIGGWYVFLALFLLTSIFLYIKLKIKKYEDYRNRNIFGDFFDAFFMKVAKYSLNKLITSKSHVKNWIPSILILGEVSH